MKNNLAPTLSLRRPLLLPPPPFVRRLSSAAAARARFPMPPLGVIGDPYLLDRLQAPLRRRRD